MNKVVSDKFNPTHQRILIRFNTKADQDPLKRCWRVLQDGVETLAHRVVTYTTCETITEPIESGEIKHHFLCYGNVVWDDNHNASIFT